MSRLAWWGWCLTTWFLVANGFLEFPWNLGLLDLTVLLWLWSDHKRTKAVAETACARRRAIPRPHDREVAAFENPFDAFRKRRLLGDHERKTLRFVDCQSLDKTP
jgi:hypothetical protein